MNHPEETPTAPVRPYGDMTYEEASREALTLISTARRSADWLDLPEKLIELRRVIDFRKREPRQCITK